MKAKHMDNGIQYFSAVVIAIIIITINFTCYFPVIIIIIIPLPVIFLSAFDISLACNPIC